MIALEASVKKDIPNHTEDELIKPHVVRLRQRTAKEDIVQPLAEQEDAAFQFSHHKALIEIILQNIINIPWSLSVDRT